MLKTFSIGGVHPHENKLSAHQPIITAEVPAKAVILLGQHIGAPAKPVVAKGDVVKVGTRIAEPAGFVSAAIHSSVSGKVAKIDTIVDASGYAKPAIFIDVEGDEWEETIDRSKTLVKECDLSAEEIVKKIADAGIVGLGGACFPTQVKLCPPPSFKAECVIINAVECEPYLTSDYRLMLERPEDLVMGLKVLLQLFDNAEGIIAIEDNKPEAIAKLQYLTQEEPKITVKPLKTKYPQGAERQVIYVTTGRKIYSKMLPADAGCVVDNVQTVLAVYDAVCKCTPSMTRVMTLTGDAMAQPQNYKVRFGMSHAELLEEAGGLVEEGAEKIISGGPMMGMAMFDLNVPITKTSSSILAMTKDEVAANEPTNCIRCGRCASVCPSHLVPQKMAEAADRQDLDLFQKLNGMECYECGTCTYVCPAKRRLTQSFKQARRAVMDQSRKK